MRYASKLCLRDSRRRDSGVGCGGQVEASWPWAVEAEAEEKEVVVEEPWVKWTSGGAPAGARERRVCVWVSLGVLGYR